MPIAPAHGQPALTTDRPVAISSGSSQGSVRYLVGGAARRPAKDTPPPDRGPGLDLTEPDSGVGGRPELSSTCHVSGGSTPRLDGASIGRRGVASSGGPRVVGADAVDLRTGDYVRLEQTGALGRQDRC